jgi:hypothetical protein
MLERTTRQTITFEQPFFVEGLGHDHPAGTYQIEILEELIEGLSFPAYRVLPLPGGGPHSYQLVRISSAVVWAAMRTRDNRDWAQKAS